MTADVRHDLRHAASTILMLVATLRAREYDQLTQSAFDGIAHSARTVIAMASEVDIDLVFEPVDLDEMVELGGRRASLLYFGTLEIVSEPISVMGTRLDLSRLLVNLVQNACRAAGPAGTVRVSVVSDGGWAILRVDDSGDGFFENPTNKGVGLSAVTAIAVRLGGHVTFERSSLGGALVSVRLPRSDQNPPGPQHEEER